MNKLILYTFFLLFIGAFSIRLQQHQYGDPEYEAWANAAAMSDKRLKTNIEFLYKSPSGINVYSFNYISDPSTTYQGVMAQELVGTQFEKAVIHGEKYMAVNYGLIDVEFK